MQEDTLHKRNHGLDIFRTLAILSVVHVHGQFLLEQLDSQDRIGNLALFSNSTFLPEIRIAHLYGGVELFFVLSGFLIGSMLIKQLHQNNYKFSLKNLMTFWKRRWFRTVPNYVLFLGLNALFVYMGWSKGNLEHFSFKFFLFLHNFKDYFLDFFWESWSLSIEEWFYIIFPFLAFISFLFYRNKRNLLAIIIVLILAPLVYRIYMSQFDLPGDMTWGSDHFWWDVRIRKVVIMRLDSIMYGVLAAYIKFYCHNFWKKSRFILLILSLCTALYLHNFKLNDHLWFYRTFVLSITPLSCSFLLPFFDSIQTMKTKFGVVIQHISKISYSMYLVNLGLVAVVIGEHFAVTSPSDGILKYFLYWSIVVGVSSIVYKYYEHPLTQLRDKKIFR